MDRPKCKTCPFWNQMADDAIDGFCKRFPPSLPHTESHIEEGNSIDETTGIYRGWFPTTIGNEWCGEHPDFPAYIASLRAMAVTG